MTLTHLNFSWQFYFCMVALITSWNLGLYAITRSGKIGYFLTAYLLRRREMLYELPAPLSAQMDRKIEELTRDKVKEGFIDQGSLDKVVKEFLDQEKAVSDVEPAKIRYNIIAQVPNVYMGWRSERVWPSHLTDPLLTCITCMASFWGLVIYTTVTIFKDLWWNPLELAAVALPCAFMGELLWSIKSKIQS